MVVLGAGNMGQAMVLGAYAKKFAADYAIFTPTGTKALALAQKVGGKKLETLAEAHKAAHEADIVVLAFKPQQFDSVAIELKGQLSEKTIVLSLLASISLEQIKKGLGVAHVVRVMPNTPASIGQGLHLYTAGESEKNHPAFAAALDFLQGSGTLLEVQAEGQLDLLTPFSGSGPAYLFELAELLEKNLEKRGFELSYARKLIVQMLKGAALYLESSDRAPAELKQNVMSKGGITEAVIKELEQGGIEELFSRALDKGLERLNELKTKK